MKIHPKNHRVMFALVALLFAVTFVHTAALIKLKNEINAPNRQQAQVVSAGNCLQVTPLYNADYAFPAGSIGALPTTEYKMFFSIKNTCAYGINIVDTTTYIGQMGVTLPQLLVSSIEVLTPLGAAWDVAIPSNTYGVQAYLEQTACLDCNGGIATYHPSPLGGYFYGGSYSIGAYSIPAGATRKVVVRDAIGVTSLFANYYRIRPTKFLWFSDAALADNSISATEVKTYPFTKVNSQNIATDYVLHD